MKLLFQLGVLIGALTLHAQGSDSSKTNYRNFELSFGQSLLFISNSKQTSIVENEAVVLPTSAVLFSAEFRPDRRLRIPVFLNLATESKQFLINGVLVNEKASPTLGSGILVGCLKYRINDKTALEFEAGPLVSCLIDTENSIRFAPIVAGRLKIFRGENFIMYLGCSYSFGIDAFGLLYGTGTSF
jgi:hypothetical protein